MNSHQQQALATFRRIQTRLAERPDLTGNSAGAASTTPAGTTSPATSTATTSIGDQSALLDAAISDATLAASQQEGLTRTILGLGATAQLQRVELVSNQMVHVATIARTALPDVVRMSEALRTPRTSRKTETLLSAADAMATAGEQYKDQLVASGLSADFPDELRSAAAALKSSVDARGVAVAQRKGTETAFSAAMARGRKAVDTMTVLIKRQFKSDPATVAEWMSLRRIPLVGVRAATGTAVPVPVPATVPAVSAPVQATAPATTPITAAVTAPEQQSRAA